MRTTKVLESTVKEGKGSYKNIVAWATLVALCIFTYGGLNHDLMKLHFNQIEKSLWAKRGNHLTSNKVAIVSDLLTVCATRLL